VKFHIERRDGYVHAELYQRDTADEMRTFLEAVKAACLEHGCPNILVAIRASRAVFKPEEYGLGTYASAMATPACRVALVGDSSELHHAHEYIELVARQQGMNVRSFRDDRVAVRWLQGKDEPGDKAPGLAAPGRGDSRRT
jgi:hypothetical protein